LIVPLKLANSPLLEPVEGSESSNHGTVLEKEGVRASKIVLGPGSLI
jgi:hypothetical protein